ncbi:porin [Mesorhizobium sp. J428]|uniref:porin n=2 Tax=Mesorhizobium sp. J428 TaxID=2898440 RepID=UPI002151C4C1|nr:porin [Mesorhizobium sp. J428]MCR5860488.1 porin [Mesorhizobium sp. J428]
MKKSLILLSSAFGALGAMPAWSADAVMLPEPEPVEYVRICDAYGAGFFYIPGTETCLAMSGYVYYQIGAESRGVGDTPPLTFHPGDQFNEGFYKTVRARVNFDARSQTDWGTLRSFIRLEANWNGAGDGPAFVDQAFIELGGLRMGYTESAWTSTQGGGVSNFPGSHSWSGLGYGYQQRPLIAYTYTAGNGFYGTLSLEDDTLAGDGYMPDVVAKVGVNQGWGGAWAQFGYDESFLGTDGYAAKLGLHLNMPNMPGSSLRLIGTYANNANIYSTGQFDAISSEWSILASYNQQFTETLGVSVAGHYYNNLHAGLATTGINAYAAETSVVWFPVSQFEVRSELAYSKIETLDGTVSGFLRFTRYF